MAKFNRINSLNMSANYDNAGRGCFSHAAEPKWEDGISYRRDTFSLETVRICDEKLDPDICG